VARLWLTPIFFVPVRGEGSTLIEALPVQTDHYIALEGAFLMWLSSLRRDHYILWLTDRLAQPEARGAWSSTGFFTIPWSFLGWPAGSCQ